MIQILPKWVLTGTRPAFYDTESGSVLEQTARIYDKMNELVESYNSFVENTNKAIADFEDGVINSQKEFEVAIRQTIQDFIDVITMRVEAQDQKIADMEEYVNTNLVATATNIINGAIADGSIAVNLVYDETSENLNLETGGNV